MSQRGKHLVYLAQQISEGKEESQLQPSKPAEDCVEFWITKKKERWFCNKSLSPPAVENTELVQVTPSAPQNCVPLHIGGPKINILDNIILRSAPGPSKFDNDDDAANSSALDSNDQQFVSPSTTGYNSDDDPEYFPSPSKVEANGPCSDCKPEETLSSNDRTNDSCSQINQECSSSSSKDVADVDMEYSAREHENAVLECQLEINQIELEEQVETTEKENYTDRRDFCMYCEKDIDHFARHMFTWHEKEFEVQRILCHELKSKRRREELSYLRKRGNFIRNRTAKQLRPVKRVGRALTISSEEFLPCCYCLGFYKKNCLYRHTKICKMNTNIQKKRQTAQSDGQTALLLGQYRKEELLRNELFPRMRADQISLIAKKNNLICAFAYSYFKGRRSKGNIDSVKTNMRRLAKLLLFARDKLGDDIKELTDLLRPKYFYHIVDCVNKMAKYETKLGVYESPALAMNFGTLIKKNCDLAYLNFLQKGCDTSERRKELKILVKLVESQWANEISAQAALNLNQNKWNKDELLPLTSDLKILNLYLGEESKKAYDILVYDKQNFAAYSTLKEILFTQILLLNRRRAAEVAQLKVNSYKFIDLNCNHENEFSECLTETEKILIDRYSRIVIRGKRGRGVPVLFSPDMRKHFDLLVEIRNNFITNNDYIFHTNGKNFFDGSKILHKYAEKCGAKQPKAITATRLRKHLATITQLLQFSDKDLEQLSQFMGHTLRTHCNVYRMSDNIYQTAKVSKLLLLMTEGGAEQFKGKKLDEINFDLSPVYADDIFEDITTEGADEEDLVDVQKIEVTSNSVGTVEEESATKISTKEKHVKKKSAAPRQPWPLHQKKLIAGIFQNILNVSKLQRKGKLKILLKEMEISSKIEIGPALKL